MGYSVTLRVGLPRSRVFAFFLDLERWFRLNPQWSVLSVAGVEEFHVGGAFDLRVCYDRADLEVDYRGVIDGFSDGESLTVRLDGEVPRRFGVLLREEEGITALTFTEDREADMSLHEKREIGLWLKSVLNYLLIQEKKTFLGRVYKLFIDRVWLRMSPFGRRITFFVVVGEALTLAFFILLLVALLIFGRL